MNWSRAAMHPGLPVKNLPWRILVCLAAHADAEGVCWPSVPTMAAMVRCTDRRVQIALRELEAAGLVKAVGRGPGGTPKRQLQLPAFAFEPIARDLPRRSRGATRESPAGATGNIGPDDVVIIDDEVHPFRRPRSTKTRGDAQVAPGGDAEVAPNGATPRSPAEISGATPTSGEGRRPGREGATPTSPEVVKYQEKQSPAADTPPPSPHEEPTSRPDDAKRLAAWIAGGGRTVDTHGKDLSGEILLATRSHTPTAIELNLARWGAPGSPMWPTAYGRRASAEEEDARKQRDDAERTRRERERARIRATQAPAEPELRVSAAEAAMRSEAQRGPLGAAWRDMIATIPSTAARDCWLGSEKVWLRGVGGHRLHLRVPTPLFRDSIGKRFGDALRIAAGSMWPGVTEITLELAGSPLDAIDAPAAVSGIPA